MDIQNSTTIPEVKKTIVMLRELSADEKVRQEAFYREKRIHDEATALNGARKEGIEIGRAEGLAEGLTEGITKGRAEGLAEGITKGRAEGLAEGLSEGITKGRAEGLTEGINEMIEKMRKSGMSEEQIRSIIDIK